MNRRTFFSLALVASTLEILPVLAESSEIKPIFQVQALSPGQWLASLRLENHGRRPLDILVEEGEHSAVEIEGLFHCPQGPIPVSTSRADRRSLLTRAGPRRTWRPLPAGGQLVLGEHRLQTISGSVPPSVATGSADLVVKLQTSTGPLELKADGIIIAAR